ASSATKTIASGGRTSRAARNVKPMPRPPTSTQGRSAVRTSRQPNVASASSEPCMRLDMRLWPLARIMYSLLRRVSLRSEPSGVVVSPSNSSVCKIGLPLRHGGDQFAKRLACFTVAIALVVVSRLRCRDRLRGPGIDGFDYDNLQDQGQLCR